MSAKPSFHHLVTGPVPRRILAAKKWEMTVRQRWPAIDRIHLQLTGTSVKVDVLYWRTRHSARMRHTQSGKYPLFTAIIHKPVVADSGTPILLVCKLSEHRSAITCAWVIWKAHTLENFFNHLPAFLCHGSFTCAKRYQCTQRRDWCKFRVKQ